MSQTIGEHLRQARGARQITLEQAAKATHIRQRFLEALENDQWDILPSKVQGRGFLRLYADFLGLKTDELLNPAQPQSSTIEAEPLPVEETDPIQEALVETKPSSVEIDAHPLRPQSGDHLPVFVEIGQTLRQRRESISLSLLDVERYTRLRSRYLQALEEGRIYDLPSPVQGRGMLSNYASFLGLDSEQILNRFAEGLQTRLAQAHPSTTNTGKSPAAKKAPTGWRRIVSGDILLGSLLVLGLLIFMIWGAAQIAAQQTNQEPAPTFDADILLNTRTASTQDLTPVPSSTLPPNSEFQATATIPISGNEPLQVYIIARQRAWLRVIEDGKEVFNGRTVPNTAYPFSAITQLEVYSGSAPALKIFFNQTEYPLQNKLGEPLRLIFTAQGVITPTPLFTATPTVTPQPTATLQPTRTQAAPTITPLIP